MTTTTDRQVFAALKRSICCPPFQGNLLFIEIKILNFSQVKTVSRSRPLTSTIRVTASLSCGARRDNLISDFTTFLPLHV